MTLELTGHTEERCQGNSVALAGLDVAAYVVDAAVTACVFVGCGGVVDLARRLCAAKLGRWYSFRNLTSRPSEPQNAAD